MRQTQAPNATTKRYYQTLPPNATTNGGRRVPRRALSQKLTDKRAISAVCEPLFGVRALYFHRRGTRRPH